MFFLTIGLRTKEYPILHSPLRTCQSTSILEQRKGDFSYPSHGGRGTEGETGGGGGGGIGGGGRGGIAIGPSMAQCSDTCTTLPSSGPSESPFSTTDHGWEEGKEGWEVGKEGWEEGKEGWEDMDRRSSFNDSFYF